MVGQKGATEALEDAAHLLMDQALILEGEPVPDPAAFARRLSGLVSRALTN
jgi:molecular chaperone HtpG